VTAGRLYVVPTPIGNLEDMTHRAVRVLGEVSVVAAEDTRSVRVLLDRYGLSPPRVVSFFEGNEAKRVDELCAEMAGGVEIALVSEAGMPGVSDPGQRLVAAAAARGIPITVLPGPSAAITALVASGLATDRFLFLGFPPREEGARQSLFGSLRAEPGSLVFYEAPPRVGATLADLAGALGPKRQAALGRELSKLHEELVRGTLGELAARYAETPPRGECTLVVAGATDAEKEAVNALDVDQEIDRLVAEGLGAAEIAARLALATGKPRRQLYQLILRRKP
jgi:16S rRNA (cytidine1402-2'-O)-methyltransferase